MASGRFLTGAVAVTVAAGTLAVTATNATRAARGACSPSATILKSPRVDSFDVQAKAINDRGDVVGFADTNRGSGPAHAILWKGGTVAGAVDLGVLPGYIASEAYGVNDSRVVFGLLYDKKQRTFPFRWEDGRMTLLKAPNGRIGQGEENPGAGGRNAINDRGEIATTLIVGGNRRAVRWTRDGKASYLPALPGQTWTDAFSINDDGVVSGWSRKLPNKDGEENPVLWTRSGKVIPLKTAPGQADGIAEATNRAGLTVGYLGNLGTAKDPENGQVAIWMTRNAAPRLIGAVRPYAIAELVDVNDRGQAAGMIGTIDPKTGFHPNAKAVIWRSGWSRLRPLSLPAASRRANRVLVPQLNDINNHGAIVGSVFGLSAPSYDRLRRIDPVRWTCQFGP
jgi:probable HAF family extracellular repeat protein